VARTGLDLFLTQGFDDTTMTEIAAAAGIGRKTLFAYFPCKAAIVWNRFNSQLAAFTAALAEHPPETASADALIDAILRGVHTDPEAVPLLRAEVTLIQQVPELEGYAHTSGKPWRTAITAFLAEREGLSVDDVLPQVLSHGYWEAIFVGFRDWIRSGEEQPLPFIERALRQYAHAIRAAFEGD
jgi:AcrR family transcriptional regulator